MNLNQYMLLIVMVMKIMCLRFSQTQVTLNYIIITLITLLAYFAVSRNANLFVQERLFTGPLYVLLGKKISWGKKWKNKNYFQICEAMLLQNSPS